MTRYFKTLVAVDGLAALSGCGGSGNGASPYDEVLAPFKDCVVGMLGSLEAIESEFPEFRENEVRLVQRKMRDSVVAGGAVLCGDAREARQRV